MISLVDNWLHLYMENTLLDRLPPPSIPTSDSYKTKATSYKGFVKVKISCHILAYYPLSFANPLPAFLYS